MSAIVWKIDSFIFVIGLSSSPNFPVLIYANNATQGVGYSALFPPFSSCETDATFSTVQKTSMGLHECIVLARASLYYLFMNNPDTFAIWKISYIWEENVIEAARLQSFTSPTVQFAENNFLKKCNWHIFRRVYTAYRIPNKLSNSGVAFSTQPAYM